jgi:isoleucyl-tRNA synthetase
MSEETKKSASAEREEKILEFWKENDIFEATLSRKENPEGEFVFYEGPPTANGKPGIHHLEARAFKDAIPRYKTMRGYHVRRKGGWDTHGLPVELQVEKALGLNSKKAIEEYGIEKFNEKCKESVWEYLSLWEKFTDRTGYWVDQKNPYVTYHNSYIESVWNVFKTVQDKGLVYKDYRIVPWCPRCGTALSSHELAQGYQDDKDLSVTAKFKVVGQENTYILAWTTTPWTLPGNVALAVGSEIKYGKWKIKEGEFAGDIYIVAVGRAADVFKDAKIFPIGGNFEELAEVSYLQGSELVGLEYEPLYPFLANRLEPNVLAPAYKVYPADFVTTEDGTGIVHTAVMYGQDDFELGTKIGLPKYHLVNPDGHFLSDMDFLTGRFVKDEDVAVDIIKDLAHRGLLFKKEKYEHSYPHCWRCKTPLIYYARDSWYIRMSDPKIKDKLISENQKINWEPAYTRDGRFGEWLKDLKDWAISRERYWGTPLPIWQTATGKIEAIGSIDELKAKTKKSGNKYFVMRHGGTEGNAAKIVSYKNQATDNLTEEGKMQVQNSAEAMRDAKIDLIVCSPFTRTRETAAIVAETLGISEDKIIIDDRLHEINPGDFDGTSWDNYHNYVYQSGQDWFTRKIAGGDSLKDVQIRTGAVLYELEKTHKDSNILLVTHGGPAWLLFVNAGMHEPQATYHLPNTYEFVSDYKAFSNAEVRELPFVPVPHNESYELDLHRPYIDQVELVSEDGEPMTRVKEVMDVWFDSGAMPFAQDHYPFETTEVAYPADFISEAIDQTRGWFYTLHAVGVLMDKGLAYKNVICLGHILDAEGKKMSKSLGNIVDPWIMADKYGVDTLRLWMYSVNQPGESKNFDEKTVAELHNKVFNLLYNVLAFYELYRDKELEASSQTLEATNVLDTWILSRLNQLIETATTNLDTYKLLEPVRAMREFIDDLSTWYVRRSRDRVKDGDVQAKQTLYYVLKTMAKLMAPFAPFAAEDIWQKLKTDTDEMSVHMATWPEVQVVSSSGEVIEEMQKLREVVTLGLQLRQKAGMPVRQPLGSLKVKNIKLETDYTAILKDELNVKEVVEDASIANDVELDITMTPELKQEGEYRELVRAVQDMRKKEGLTPSDSISLTLPENTQDTVKPFLADMKKTVLAENIVFAGEEIKITR